MLGLFKKKKYNSVVKFIKLIDLDYALSFDNKTFIINLLHFVDTLNIGQATNYYITGPYPDKGWTTKTGFLNALEKKEFKDVILLLISGENFAIRFENWLPNFDNPPKNDTIRISLEASNDLISIDKLIELSKSITTQIDFDYGYAFSTDQLLGLSESNAKKTWYGLSGQTSSKENVWEKEILKVGEGKIKDVYQYNFLSLEKHAGLLNKLRKTDQNNLSQYNSNLQLWTVNSNHTNDNRQNFAELIIA